MPKHANLELQDQAFLMYSAGIKLADIAKDLKVTPNTLQNWKNKGNWDLQLVDSPSIETEVNQKVKELTTRNKDTTILEATLQDVVNHAINVDRIKPTKWKDVLDTLAFLGRGAPKPKTSTTEEPKDVTDVSDEDLEKQIASLKDVLNFTDEAILVETGDNI